jgi:hypothetical protein
MPLTISSVGYNLIPSFAGDANFWEGDLVLNFNGTPRTGDIYSFEISTDSDSDFAFPSFTISYTVLAGNSLSDVLNNLVSLFNANPSFHNNWPNYPSPPDSTPWIPGTNGIKYTATTGTIITSDSGLIKLSCTYSPYKITCNWTFTYADTTASLDGLSNAVYKHNSTYSFGIVYFDEFGVTDGVHTIDALTITTPATFNPLVTVNPLIPVIYLEINNQPPIWATNYAVVRTNNLTIQDCVPAIYQDILADTAQKYTYVNILSLETNTEKIPTYEFIEGDRMVYFGIFTVLVSVLLYMIAMSS